MFLGAKSQFLAVSDTFNYDRTRGIIFTESLMLTGYLIGMNELWYKDYPRQSFQSFNDNREWLQMDKVGHALSCYYVGWANYKVLRWAGIKKNPSIWIGGSLGLAALTMVEVLDGFSAGWGFSVGDMAANVSGYALFGLQEQFWDEQRMVMKYSFHNSPYRRFRPNILGTGGITNIIKDYNGQTHWLSVNPSSFMAKDSKFPDWLSLAVGYGASGMTGGHSNPIQLHSDGSPPIQFKRERQWYFSPDIDLRKLNIKNPWLKLILGTVNFIKVPMPTLELKAGNKLRFHPIYF
ncbi:MAG TPA: DUF2279 domain-containing protein [Flavobacteriales bacterium]|mgnify:CR=1 FL=1|jgi:hypothetical protein|nr:YfiM family protein [Salibacteraceae bacterium]HAS36631.1 DUF2279 domain-containing protein [Flavobacteriales bacterium]